MAQITIPLFSNVPTAGYWNAGTVVLNSSATVYSPHSGSEYTVWGWKRLTTGASNVLGTDWVEMRALDGS